MKKNKDLTQDDAPADVLDLTEEQETQLQKFNRAVEDWMSNAEHDYYNNVPPRPLPAVPELLDETGSRYGAFLVPTKKLPFRYQKVTLPNGKTYLAIVLLPVELPR